jgi:hypothetical protein
MECPKCKAKVGIMRHQFMVETGAVHCVKCYICGYWVQAERGPVMPLPPRFPGHPQRLTLGGNLS